MDESNVEVELDADMARLAGSIDALPGLGVFDASRFDGRLAEDGFYVLFDIDPRAPSLGLTSLALITYTAEHMGGDDEDAFCSVNPFTHDDPNKLSFELTATNIDPAVLADAIDAIVADTIASIVAASVTEGDDNVPPLPPASKLN